LEQGRAKEDHPQKPEAGEGGWAAPQQRVWFLAGFSERGILIYLIARKWKTVGAYSDFVDIAYGLWLTGSLV
jgi:hypothetical protein